MSLTPASGFVLALTVAVGMVVTTFPQDEPQDSPAPAGREPKRQELLMSDVGVPPPSPSRLSPKPPGVLGDCPEDGSRHADTTDRGARDTRSRHDGCP